jgi:hypothetical protein
VRPSSSAETRPQAGGQASEFRAGPGSRAARLLLSPMFSLAQSEPSAGRLILAFQSARDSPPSADNKLPLQQQGGGGACAS